MFTELDDIDSDVEPSPDMVVPIDVSAGTSDAVVDRVRMVAVVHVSVSDVEAMIGVGMLMVEVSLMPSVDV